VKKCLLLFLVFCFVGSASATVKNQYAFTTPQKNEQYARLTNELRCMVCQNESIASSTATFAIDLRQQVYQMVKAGKDDNAIKSYMTARYGNFILFKPPLIQETYLLWFAPLLLLIIGGVIAFCVIKKYRNKA